MGCITSKHGDGGDRTLAASVPVSRKNCHGCTFSSSSKQHSWRIEVDGDVEKLEEIVNPKKSRELKSLKREGSGRKSGTFSFKLGIPQRFVEAEHVAAGWPSWLSSAAGEAVHGWVPMQADSFEKLDKIGQGTYSSVFKAREIETGRMVALKKVRFDNFQPESIRFMAREITILRRLNHPNIMKLEGVITSRFSSTIYLVFEYMEHDLSGLSSCPDINFSEAQVKCYMKQLLMGLEHCHLRGVMHRDIKASNILVNNEGVLKFGDFGLANILTSKNRQQLTSRVVTLWYRPPELLMGSTSYDVSVDLWSVGCVFAEVLMGKPILKGRTEVEQLHKIFKLCGSPSDEYWKKLKLPHSTMFKPQHPYESCLQQRCKEIPAAALNLLETLLSVEPHKRGTASSSLRSDYFHTKPYPCDPSSMPKYSPNKEMDAKQRDDLRRKKLGAKIRDPVGVTIKARRPRKMLQEANSFNGTIAKEEEHRDNARFGGRNNGADYPKPREGLSQPFDTRSDTSRVTTVSQGDVYTAPPPLTGSNGFAWPKKQKESKSTLSYNQPSPTSEISYPDSSSFIFRNTDNIFRSSNPDVSEGVHTDSMNRIESKKLGLCGVMDQEAHNKLGKTDFFDAIDGFPLGELTTKHKNKLKVGCSGPLVFESDQVDELLQWNENHIRLAARRTRAYVQNSQPAQAFAFFFEMQWNGIVANSLTYPFLLKACHCLKMVEMIHTQMEKNGFFSDIFVPNALIDNYSKFGALGVKAALRLFMVMGDRDAVSWNSMVGGLLRVGELREARKLFDEMPERNIVSWNSILNGYVKEGKLEEAFELFENMPQRNIVSWSTMVMGYSKVGDMDMARAFFDKMPIKTLVPWTIIISGYAEKGFAKEAIALCDHMLQDGFELDDGAIISILAACAKSGSLAVGVKVHDSIEMHKVRCSVAVCNALVNMYAKCGSLDRAWSVFNGMSKRDVVSWNIMLHAFAVHGHGREALHVFKRMKKEGFNPDRVTFVGVLCACSHAGLIDEGIQCFYTMEKDYGVVPGIEHYGCMIDLLGRGGRLKEAFMLVHSMPFEPNAIIWGTLLGACRLHGATELAEKVHDHHKLDSSDPGNYSVLANIFAAAGDWDGVSTVRLRMKSIGVQKPSGASSIEIDNEVGSGSKASCTSQRCNLAGRSNVLKTGTEFDSARLPIIGSTYRVRRKSTCGGNSASFPSINGQVLALLSFRSFTYICQIKIPSSFYPRKVAFPISITCCHLNEDNSKPTFDSDWRSFRAKLVANEKESSPKDPSSPCADPGSDQPRQPVTIGDKWAHTIHEPEKGCLLIATKKLDGVHIFERTVILLLKAGPIGPSGIILNRPSLMSIREMRSTILDGWTEFSDQSLYFGGPLEDGFFLVSTKRDDDSVEKSGAFEQVMEGVYYGSRESVGCAAEMVKRNVVEGGDFRFFDGYCLWDKEQLDGEIKAGFWTVVACSPSVIALQSVGNVGLWEEILELISPKKVW
ncbi:hypothetical protein V6N11_014650 [Hibiscus sabdariffa]|uniref:Protein kinase domain-containing protein n=1 Tax=Hibiscus sabdariffa TaxID=183260 RepID=A0ABR2TPP4_9ROSI